MKNELTTAFVRGLEVTWHFLAAATFVFLSTMIATLGALGYAPLVNYGLAALFLVATVIGASAGYGIHQNKSWAAVASHALTVIIAVCTVGLLTMPFYAQAIAPRTNIPFYGALIITTIAFFVSGHLATTRRKETCQ